MKIDEEIVAAAPSESMIDNQFGVITREHIAGYLRCHGPRFRELVRLTKLWCRGRRVAEVGVAYGSTLLSLHRERFQVEGFELAENIPVYCGGLIKAGIPVHPLDCYQGGISRTFDFLICSEVVEHLLVGLPRILANLRPLLRPGGRILLTTPNLYRAGNLHNVLRGINIQEKHPAQPVKIGHLVIEGRTHPREYCYQEIVESFRAPEWKLLKCWTWGGTRKANILHRIASPFLGYPLRNVLFAVAERT